MPKYTNNSLQVDQFTADQANVVKSVASDGFYFNSGRARYQRIHAYECPLLLSSGLVASHPVSTAGRPVTVAMSNPGDTATYNMFPRVPLGCQLNMIWVLFRTPGTETGTDTLVTRTLNVGGEAQLSGFTVAHSNNVTNYAGRVINHTDAQITSDPAATSDFTWYQIEYKQGYDATAGGGQVFYFWGFILKYTLLTTTQLREST